MTDDKADRGDGKNSTAEGEESHVSATDETVERQIADDESAESASGDAAEDTAASDTAASDTANTSDGATETVAALPGAAFQDPDSGSSTVVRLLVPLTLLVLFLGSLGIAAFAYLAWYQPDRKVDDAVAASVLQSASDGAVALLSYTPETLDQDFTNAKTRLTGDFLSYYTQFTQEIVTPAAKQKSVKTSAAVVRSALSKLEPTTAEVLLFINQSTVSKENPDGSFTASSVKVEMTKVGDAWLISSFDPV